MHADWQPSLPAQNLQQSHTKAIQIEDCAQQSKSAHLVRAAMALSSMWVTKRGWS